MSASHASLVTSGGVPIQLSHLEKVFFPADGLGKATLSTITGWSLRT